MRSRGWSTEPSTTTTTNTASAAASAADVVVPSLILLARDVRPSTVLGHVRAYANLLNVPMLILPGGKASAELGKAAGGLRFASMAMFLPRGANGDVDSFVRYATSKIPK